MNSPRLLLIVLTPALVFLGCDRNTSETVNTSEPSAARAPAAAGDNTAGGMGNDMTAPAGGAAVGAPQQQSGDVLTYKLPAGWTETPGGANMRYATLNGPDNAQVAITVFGNAAGMTNLANINRWRGQLGLAPIQESELDANLTKVQTAGPVAVVTDQKSADGSQRLIAAIVPDEGKAWYLKFQGPTDVVAKHADEYHQIVKSCGFAHAHP